MPVNGVVKECWVQLGPRTYQYPISTDSADAAAARSLRGHRRTVRVNGTGRALEPANGLVTALEERGFGQSSWQHRSGTHLGVCAEPLCSCLFSCSFGEDVLGKGRSLAVS